MSFKEFVKWCNERACDGCWGPITAIYCINAINIIREKPFWKREKEWQKYNAEMKIVEKLVYPTNEKIKFIDDEENRHIQCGEIKAEKKVGF